MGDHFNWHSFLKIITFLMQISNVIRNLCLSAETVVLSEFSIVI